MVESIYGDFGMLHGRFTTSIWWCNNHLEKYESQWEGLSHILWKIKTVPNHQPDIKWYRATPGNKME